MNKRTLRHITIVAVATVSFVLAGASDRAVASGCIGEFAELATPQPVSPSVIASEVQQLRQAYLILAKCDHDYQGHRVLAMHAVEKACALLGTDITGDSKNVQPQPTSDAELKQSQQIIQTVQTLATSNGQKKVANHLARAVNDINVALSLK
jgi:hypothetical protein